MHDRLRAEAVRLQVVRGRLQVRELLGGTAVSPGRTSNWGEVYPVSHVVSHDGGTERVCDRLEGVTQETYRQSVGGVTNRLRQAMRNANRYLYLRNRVRRERQPLLAAMGCLAIRGTDAYACGAGPYSIFLVAKGRVRSFATPAEDDAESMADDSRRNGYLLGRSAKLADPRFSYRQLQPGDWILLVAGAQAGILRRIADQLAVIAGENDINRAAQHVCGMTEWSAEVSALLVRVGSDTPQLEEVPRLKPEGARRSLVSTAQTFLPIWGHEKGRKEEVSQRPPEGKNLPPSAQQRYVQEEDAFAKSPDSGLIRDWGEKQDGGRPRSSRQSHDFLQQSAEICRLTGAVLLSLLAALWGGGQRLVGAGVELIRCTWKWIRHHRILERLARISELALFGTWAASKGLAVRILPERQASVTTYRATARPMAKAKVRGFQPSLRSRVLIGALIILAVALAVITSGLRIKWRLEQAEMERLTSQVEESLRLAELEEDWRARAALLAEAQELIDQAAEAQGNSPAIRELSDRLESQWVLAAGGVGVAFGSEPVLAVPEGLSRRIIVPHNQVYILNETAQRLYRCELDQQGDPLAEQGPWTWELSGEAGTVPEELVVDMAWADAANGRLTPAVLMVTSEGSLVELNPSGTARNVSVSDTAPWEDVRAVRTYEGNLYVLDVGRGNILKYVATGDDYRDPPMNYIAKPESVPWDSVIDMAIDGSIYLLLSNGSIMKFAAGQPQAFPQEGLHPPLENPVALFASPDSGSVFVAEPSQARIVEFSTDGRFLRQFRETSGQDGALAGLQAFGVDVARDRLLVGTRVGVFSAPFPPAE